jgi:hypothetical protein
MKYRLSTVLEREEHASDTTKVIDILGSDKISRLAIIHEAYNSASGAQTAHPSACITKIELIDGSDVIFSLSGKEAQAADWYNNGVEPQSHANYLPTLYGEQVFNINFGRFLHDPMLAFDPVKFTNPQLKITIDVNGGGSTVTTGYLTVLAHIFDEKAISPMGFLMHKQLKDYALAASSHEYTDLPTDYPYRKLFARIQKYGTAVRDCFDTIKLSEDNDKRIPVNHTIFNILKSISSIRRPYQELVLHEGSAALYYVYITPAEKTTMLGTQWRSTASQAVIGYMNVDGGRASFDQYSETSNTQALAIGWCPHGVVEIPFGDQNEVDDWYDVTKIKSLRLDIKTASGVSSSDSCQIFLQQLRKY